MVIGEVFGAKLGVRPESWKMGNAGPGGRARFLSMVVFSCV